MTKKGKVVLLGAGPGDIGLMTIKGAEVLQKCEVLVYDRLVSIEILDMCNPKAIKINVGKETDHHNIKQEQINQIILENALAGNLVVRLKGGDPFLFGRGGEELELLQQVGVEFEVIPGVTSPLSALAYAGIPATHRELSSSVHIITAHAKDGGCLNIDFNALVSLKGTLIFLMGVSTVSLIEKGLLDAGIDKNTPVAIVENGTRQNQRSFTGLICELANLVHNNHIRPPAVIAVGEVCSLASRYAWYDVENVQPILYHK